LGTVEGESSASDALSNLDMVFIGPFGAQLGRWVVVADLLYLDLSNEKSTPLPRFGDASVKVTATALSGYALYRLMSDPAITFDSVGGFRAFDLDTKVAVGPGITAGFSQELDAGWVDPLIAARVAVPLDKNWTLTGFADWGGTAEGDQTWQKFRSIKYAINDRRSTQIGYRDMETSNEL
jgi:hypothetical protein